MVQTEGASQKTLDRLSTALDSGTFVDVRRMLNGLSPADVAHLLESSPPKFRQILWQMVDVEREGEVLGELPDELQADFLRDMEAAQVAQITEGLEDDDVADILQQLQVPVQVKLYITPEAKMPTEFKDLERDVARVKDLGATISQDIFSFPGGRRFHFTEPSGNEFAVWSDAAG